MPYDIFISYSRRDNAQGRVTQLVERISADFASFAGRPLNVFFDQAEIQSMDDWRHSILRGLRESRLLLACLSPAYLDSEYCEWEFVEYLKHEVARGFIGEGIAPVYFVAVPGWDDRKFDEQIADWIKDLRRRQTLDLRPWYDEGEATLHDAEIQGRMAALSHQIRNRIQQGEVVERGLGNVDRHNPYFIGRVEDLRRLRETVSLGHAGLLVAIHGVGGMGKTSLAVEYAHAFAREYGGGRWQAHCEGREDLRVVLASLAPVLGVEFNDEEELDLDRQFARIISELRKLADAHEPHQCLLILDNVDQRTLLDPVQTQRLPAGSWLHIIVTTRLGEVELSGHHGEWKFLPVDELSSSEAIALIESYYPSGQFQNENEREAAAEIVRLLDRLTLAVEAVAVFLRQFPEVTCQAFLDRLRSEGLEGLETAVGQTDAGLRHGEKRLTATLQPTLERLAAPVRLALRFAALLPADHVALSWIRALVAEDFPEIGIDAKLGYPDAWLNLTRRLLSLRLWQASKSQDEGGRLLAVRMHRLLQEVVSRGSDDRGGDLEPRLIEHAKKRCLFLEEGWLDWTNRWELEPLRALTESLLAQEHRQASWLAIYVGRRLRELARYAEAEPLLRRAVPMAEQSHGSGHPDVATALNQLAQLLTATNRLAEAEPLLHRALAIDEQTYGPDHPRMAIRLNQLGLLLKDTNRLGDAEPLLRRALTIAEQSLGPEHPEVATNLSNLALLLQDTNRLGEAEPLIRRALAIDERCYGPEHPEVATRLNNLAQLLQTANRLAEAEPLMRRTLAIDEHNYGPEHPVVAIDLNNLGRLLQATNRLTEAEPFVRRALAIDEQSNGLEHPFVAIRLNTLASLLLATNRLAEAEPLILRALAIAEKSYGPEHTRVADGLNNLAQLLQATNRLAEAEPVIRRALTIAEQSLGPEHPDVAIDLSNLARLMMTLDRLTEAEPLLRRAVEILLKFTIANGHEHQRLQTTLESYEGLLQQMGRSEQEIQAHMNEVGRPFGMQLGGG